MRQIPVRAGSASDTITLSDAMPALAWTPPGKPDTIAMSGRVELPDPDEARGWAMAALMGGTLLTLALTLALIPVALLLQSYQIAMVGGALLWLIPPGLFLAVVGIRFFDRRRVDHRVREAMPTPRPRVEVSQDTAIIKAAKVDDAMSDRARHLHKLMTLATWAASEERDEAGNVVKVYGAAPALRRDGKGYGRYRRALTVHATGDTIRLEEQQQLQSELAAVGILKKYPDGWALADPAWTLDDVVDRMEAAFGDE